MATVFAASLAFSARAHVGQPVGGVDGVATPAGVEIEATYGLLLPEPSAVPGRASWAWVCHEAVTAPGALRSPRYAHGGAWLAWVGDPNQGRDRQTLFRSVDGCAWDVVEDARREVVHDAAFDPTDPARAVAAAGRWVLASTDAGATFAPLPEVPDRTFRSVRVWGGVVVAAAVDAAEAAAYVLTWDGAAWSEVPLPDRPAPVDARVAGLDGSGGALAADLVLDPVGADTVLRLLGGVVTPVHDAPGQVTDLARDGDTLWIVEDGVSLVSVRDGVAERHAAWPLGVGLGLDGGALVAVPQSWAVGSLVSRSTDGGASFRVEAWPDDVRGPLDCPAGTEVADVCGPLWDVLVPDLRGFDVPPPTDTGDPLDLPDPDRPEPEDTASPPPVDSAPEPPRAGQADPLACGCATGPRGSAFLGLGVGVALLRRRRPGP